VIGGYVDHEIVLCLTEHEKRVLQLVAQGMTNKEIGGLLGVKPRTVEFHLNKIFYKMNVSCRTAAAILAEKLGLLGQQDEP